MEDFIVSALKYRPTTWDTVVGQKSITGTLQNAINNHHLAHAYLFCGPRGVGKTTCARIFARVINDASEGDDMSFNVFELDAASNNSVDDIRNLTDQVRVPPQTGKYKVYIIDEVHMLSQAAFNAFLKTLEEPPDHAIFILATTEKHKIIPTILSRCQIFDFNRIRVEDIANYLATIAEKEGVAANPDALHIIAQKADGAMRDALSIFDQLVSFAGNNLTYEAVIQNLNILDYDYYFKVTEHIVNENIQQCLLIFDEILRHGFDGHNFINGLAEHFRNLLVCKDASTASLLEVGEKIRQRYVEQSNSTNQIILIRGFDVISHCDVNYKASKNQRLLVELALIKLCSIKSNEEKKNDNNIDLLPPGDKHNGTPEPPQPVAITTPIDTDKTLSENQSSGVVAEPEPEKIETPRPVRKITGAIKLKTSTISISELVNPKKDSETIVEEGEESNLPAEEFEKDQFITAWKQYAEKVREEGKDSLHSTLTKREPALTENKTIELVIDNLVQEQVLAQEKSNLMDYLRNELNNFELQLEIKMNETEDSVHLYTNREKFMRMAEKNPALLKLRDNLDLDIEY